MSSCYPTVATKQNIASDWKRQSGDSWRQMLKWNSCSKHSYQTISIRLMYYLAYHLNHGLVAVVAQQLIWAVAVQYLCNLSDFGDFCDCVTVLSTCVTVLVRLSACATCVTVLVRLVWLPLWVALSWPADAVGLIRIHSLSAFRVAAQHLLDNSTSANHNGDSVKLNPAFNG